MSGLIFLALGCGGCSPSEDSDSRAHTGHSEEETGHSGETAVGPWVDASVDDADPVLLPMTVGVDSVRSRGFVVSLSLPTVAVVNLETGALIGRIALPNGWRGGLNQIEVGPSGRAWMTSAGTNPLLTLDANLMEANPVAVSYLAVNDVAVTDGAVFVTARTFGDQHAVEKLDPNTLEVLASRPFTLPMTFMTADPQGDFIAAITLDGTASELVILDAQDLSPRRNCALPFAPSELAHTTIDGVTTFMLVSTTALATTTCRGTVTELEVGLDITGAYGVSDGFVALDRDGPDDLRGKNWSVARHFDVDLNPLDDALLTGKHSGFGGVDTETGWVWMNSEGTADIWAVDPLAWEVALTSERLGTHVEMLAPHPRDAGRVVVTGRLSQTVAWTDQGTGEVRTATPTFDWPGAPTFDADGQLWLMDLLTSELHAVDEDFAVVQTIDPGLGDNTTLFFSHMVLHASRGTLWVSNGDTKDVAEIDPGTGDVLGAWTLSGHPNTEGVGRLQLLNGPDGVVYAMDKDAGFISRLTPDEGAVQEAALSDSLMLRLAQTNLRDLAWYQTDGALWIGNTAFDPSTLEPTGATVEVTHLLGTRSDGSVLGVANDALVAVDIDQDEVLQEWTLDFPYAEGELRHVPDWGVVIYTAFGSGDVKVIEVE